MKKMTCKDLGGACDMIFEAETFQEIAQLSQAHGKKMFMLGDPAHLKAMEAMRTLMQSPDEMNKWMKEKEAAFNALPQSE